jgi:cytochrome c oxidase assembly protein subunit 11
MNPQSPIPNPQLRNIRLAINLLALAAGMAMLAYASVPLYRLFCQMTGYGGTTQEGKASTGKIFSRTITVAFNADTDPALPWQFSPGEHTHKVKVGEQALTHFTAHNLSNAPVTGRAVYNVVPFKAGPYFVKIECFCFKEQTLKPGEKVSMPVSFYIDPAIMDDPEMNDVKTITLSYTFFVNK